MEKKLLEMKSDSHFLYPLNINIARSLIEFPATTNRNTSIHSLTESFKPSLNEFPNEILSLIIRFLSDINTPQQLWSLRRVNRRWRYNIHQVIYENVKYRFSHLPNTLQLFICQINARAITYSDPIRVHVTGLNEETGEIVLNCQRHRHSLRISKKTKLFLVVRKKNYMNNNGNNKNSNDDVDKNHGINSSAGENVKFRTEQRKEVLRDGKHSILVENSFKIEYELVRNGDAIRTKDFVEKCLSVLSFVVSPMLVLETLK
ncbi:4791_t:CDS:2 [Ambispora leptoticha]|uniref:4791_t:CDS:1 n=1 Tax=Ambispora leptoticha TaxID=144679 RepID=A0A9N8VQD5_9GLOM|nr:4791_t:CDS:2 [Ambispora leptoticha]